jgi:peptidoglycan-N-acetylglucosamine deacetylase
MAPTQRLIWPNSLLLAGEAPVATLCLTFDNMGSALSVGQGLAARPGPADAGPAGYPETLDLLNELGLRATFFIEGWNALHNPAAPQAVASCGHEVAIHGWVHETIHMLDAIAVERVLADSTAAFACANIRSRGFRASGGRRGPHLLPLLERYGFAYDSSVDHGPADPEDQARHPEPLMLNEHLMNIPWQWRNIDYYHYNMHPDGERRPSDVERHFRQAIDELSESDGFLTLIFHPHVSGQDGQRLETLRAILRHADSVTNIRIRTAGDVAAALCPRPSEARWNAP